MLAQVFNPTDHQEERSRHNAGKHSSTAQRVPFHSSVHSAACHEQKLRPRHGIVNDDGSP